MNSSLESVGFSESSEQSEISRFADLRKLSELVVLYSGLTRKPTDSRLEP